jgi:hypothetical protein
MNISTYNRKLIRSIYGINAIINLKAGLELDGSIQKPTPDYLK